MPGNCPTAPLAENTITYMWRVIHKNTPTPNNHMHMHLLADTCPRRSSLPDETITTISVRPPCPTLSYVLVQTKLKESPWPAPPTLLHVRQHTHAASQPVHPPKVPCRPCGRPWACRMHAPDRDPHKLLDVGLQL